MPTTGPVFRRPLRWRSWARALAASSLFVPTMSGATTPFVQIVDAEAEFHYGHSKALSGSGIFALTSETPSMSGAPTSWHRWDAVGDSIFLGRPCVPEPPPYDFLPPDQFPEALSWDGDLVAGRVRLTSFNDQIVEAIRWTIDETCSAELLGDLGGGAHDSGANAMSADGSILAGWGTDDEGRKAVLWDGGGPTVIGDGDLPGGDVHAEVTALSSDGSIAVGFGTTDVGLEAFRWDEATGYLALGTFPGGPAQTRALAVSADGSIAVGAAGLTHFESRAFRWDTGNGTQPLLGPTDQDHPSRALAVSSDGARIGGTWDDKAVLWDHGGRAQLVEELLDSLGVSVPEGWALGAVTGLSADGSTLLGVANRTDVAEATKAWIAFVPEPGTGTAAAAAFGALLGLARMRRFSSK